MISDKNNDKKFHFLSRETQPDYRKINQKVENKNTVVGIKQKQLEDNIQVSVLQILLNLTPS